MTHRIKAYRYSNYPYGEWWSIGKPNPDYRTEKEGTVGGKTLYEREFVVKNPYYYMAEGYSPAYPVNLYRHLFNVEYVPDFFQNRKKYEDEIKKWMIEHGYDAVIFVSPDYPELWVFNSTGNQ